MDYFRTNIQNMNTSKQNKIGFWVIVIVIAIAFSVSVMEIVLKAKY